MNNKDNALSVIKQAIRYFKLPIRDSTVDYELLSHHSYPSLKSLCDGLSTWNIDNFGVRMDLEELSELKAPFIAHIKDPDEKLIFVPSFSSSGVFSAYDSMSRSKEFSFKDFKEKYSGVSLLLDPSNNSGEIAFKEKKQDETLNRMLPIMGVLGLVCYMAYSINTNISVLILDSHWIISSILKIVGVGLSVILVTKDLKLSNNILDKMCKVGTKMDCDSILGSAASKVYGWMHWSDIGLAYFLTGFLVMLSDPNNGMHSYVVALSLMAPGYVVYSIHYQLRIAKVWCPFCLAVQAIFLLEAIGNYQIIATLEFSLGGLIGFGGISGTIILLILLLKNIFLKQKEIYNERLRSLTLKRNPEVFKSLLVKGTQKKNSANLNGFSFGNSQSNVELTCFFNLNCTECKGVFNELIPLIEKNIANVQIVFHLEPQDQELVNQLNSFMQLEKKHEAIGLVKAWYASGKKQIRQEKTNHVMTEDTEFGLIQKVHETIFEKFDVTRTPTVFVNGYKLPKMYRLSDLIAFANQL